MRYIQHYLKAPAGTNLQNSLNGIALADLSPYNGPLIDAYWDYSGKFMNYILQNVCQSTICH